MSKGIDLVHGVEFLNIGIRNSDVVVWRSDAGRSFPIDILIARNEAKEEFYTHTETKARKTVFIKRNEFVFIIGGQSGVQYQLLEAALEQITEGFMKAFGDYPVDLLLHGAGQGFAATIPDLLLKAQNENVKWVQANCFICKQRLQICVKKSLIKNAKRLPIAVVFFHMGHGLLVYIDANYDVRGEEIVDISG